MQGGRRQEEGVEGRRKGRKVAHAGTWVDADDGWLTRHEENARSRGRPDKRHAGKNKVDSRASRTSQRRKELQEAEDNEGEDDVEGKGEHRAGRGPKDSQCQEQQQALQSAIGDAAGEDENPVGRRGNHGRTGRKSPDKKHAERAAPWQGTGEADGQVGGTARQDQNDAGGGRLACQEKRAQETADASTTGARRAGGQKNHRKTGKKKGELGQKKTLSRPTERRVREDAGEAGCGIAAPGGDAGTQKRQPQAIETRAGHGRDETGYKRLREDDDGLTQADEGEARKPEDTQQAGAKVGNVRGTRCREKCRKNKKVASRRQSGREKKKKGARAKQGEGGPPTHRKPQDCEQAGQARNAQQRRKETKTTCCRRQKKAEERDQRRAARRRGRKRGQRLMGQKQATPEQKVANGERQASAQTDSTGASESRGERGSGHGAKQALSRDVGDSGKRPKAGLKRRTTGRDGRGNRVSRKRRNKMNNGAPEQSQQRVGAGTRLYEWEPEGKNDGTAGKKPGGPWTQAGSNR
ncbi:Hypothetical predicted protein [Mytilus galloprovincialis]|uniref:Uncharacterized protein n=1 Tax=Mytilus galloprovincialis TaxID=29158 RepID=A0A8B6FQ85_MYTGA|nr:Hypothetical predicted protein [Mytilus galloprovincialis]